MPNLDLRFIRAIREALQLGEFDWHPEKQSSVLNAEKVFQYIYAVLHSRQYRLRFGPFLKVDFPRVPIPGSRELFEALIPLGRQLVQWHLLEHPTARAITTMDQPRGVVVPNFFGKDLELSQVGERMPSAMCTANSTG